MKTRLDEKSRQIKALYDDFEQMVRDRVAGIVCRPGCADCCTNVGNIDAVTLEGWAILTFLRSLPTSQQKELNRKLKENRKQKSTSKFARCAFLREDRTCAVYPVRPFSCRRLYSITVCGQDGPTVHRPVWETAERTAAAIQTLDDTGYSGHISYILTLLNDARFRNVYLDGRFDPEAVRDFAREHGLSINRFLKFSS